MPESLQEAHSREHWSLSGQSGRAFTRRHLNLALKEKCTYKCQEPSSACSISNWCCSEAETNHGWQTDSNVISCMRRFALTFTYTHTKKATWSSSLEIMTAEITACPLITRANIYWALTVCKALVSVIIHFIAFKSHNSVREVLHIPFQGQENQGLENLGVLPQVPCS